MEHLYEPEIAQIVNEQLGTEIAQVVNEQLETAYGSEIAHIVNEQLGTVARLNPDLGRLRGPEIAQAAKDQLEVVTGLTPDTISSLRKNDGGWRVTVEMVEMKRIPNSSDLLGTYDVDVDDQGNILEYRRTRRYGRQESMSGE